ncbi:hypothetical protein ZWY2020_035751 [Hordeum vulgare]|nr:hypothetical protein ZWY2020_035751 [Hordeum vulgare]
MGDKRERLPRRRSQRLTLEMSTIIMSVDLECDRCYKKIRKVLCKLQDRENIKMISYDEKSNMVTVSGSFDAEEMNPGAKVAPKQHNRRATATASKRKVTAASRKNKHVKFGMDDDERIDRRGHHDQDMDKATDMDMDTGRTWTWTRTRPRAGHGHGHGNGQGGKPTVVTTTAMSRNEAPRAQQPASLMAMAPMRMPTPAPSMTMMSQAMASPSIWPAAPEWGYSAPAYGHGYAGGAPAGGYYGGPVYDHGAYGAYGRNPYQPQYYEEEPSAGCSVM